MTTHAPSAETTLDPLGALTSLLADVGLSTADAGGTITFEGKDPIVAARHRLGACIGIPMMGNAVAAAAMLTTASLAASADTNPIVNGDFADTNSTWHDNRHGR